jgi:hypothetical protein
MRNRYGEEVAGNGRGTNFMVRITTLEEEELSQVSVNEDSVQDVNKRSTALRLMVTASYPDFWWATLIPRTYAK